MLQRHCIVFIIEGEDKVGLMIKVGDKMLTTNQSVSILFSGCIFLTVGETKSRTVFLFFKIHYLLFYVVILLQRIIFCKS